MSELGEVLQAFLEATGSDAVVWRRDGGEGAPLRFIAGTRRTDPPDDSILPALGTVLDEPTERGRLVIVPVAGPRAGWLVLGPCPIQRTEIDRYLKFLRPVVTQYLQNTLEVEHAANELAERYEEINLLYSISEILGRTVSLEDGAATILREVSETVGARRGSILIFDHEQNALVAIARMGGEGTPIPPIALDDECSVSAHVFRTLHSVIVEGGQMQCDAEQAFRRGAMLTVPILWTTQEGSEPLGVVNLSDRRSGQAFSAGDQKLVTAIASQIGAAIQNARLVRQSLDQQRLQQEMQLAHDLQMKLLPDAAHVAPEATVAARVVPAEDVGGDFYNLYRLSDRRIGVMIGDVSGHGYQAALIMALTMSASAIHAQGTADPAEMLLRLYNSVKEELTTTEMFVSALYAVVDRERRELRYGNMGHPHAFVITRDGAVERLVAGGPPLGMLDDAPDSMTRAWDPEGDVLLLFTDGITDARNREGQRLDEAPVLECVVKHRDEPPAQIAGRVFALLDNYTGDTPRRDDLTLVVLKS
ncbi:MAG: protein phosphatase domain protein [Gemmatimonadetes bacterium]|jgi:sigma-B regulation protein RsbU (phosphoserine phosphatase)|nr:protein phosphatase domain protein [Gemmatimonadota bacterium]